MKSNTAPVKKKQPASLLDKFKNSKPEGGLPFFRFEEGTAVAAKFLGRRHINTKLGEGNVLDLDILECSDGETVGPHSVFESTHIKKILDSKDLKRGDRFYLKHHETDAKSGFKRFVFELVDGEKAPPPVDDDIPF